MLQQYVELSVLAGLAWWSEPWRPCGRSTGTARGA